MPCGYGPTNRQYGTLSSAQLRDDVESGRWEGTVTVYGNRTTTDVDQSGRYVAGVHLPQSSFALTNANGLIVDGNANVGEFHELHFHLTAENRITSLGGAAFGAIVPPIAASLSYETASVDGEVYNSRHFSSSASLGVASQSRQTHGNGAIDFSYAPTNADRFVLRYQIGMLALPTASYEGIADPPSLQYNCDAHNAVGFGPFSSSNDPTTAQTTLDWQHSGRVLSADVSLSRQTQFDAPIQAIVGAGALSSTYFTPSYLTGVAQNYAAACGSAAAPLTTADLYYTVGAITPRATYDNAKLALHFAPSRNVALDLSYGLTFARASAGIGPAFSRESTLIPGEQLPQTPVHTLDLLAAGTIGRGGITALADASFVGANNANDLPAYLTIDAGVRFPLKRSGALTVSFLNLTNAHGGIFTTSVGAVPLPMRVGSFATLAVPLMPHAIQASWQLPIGPDVDLAAPPVQCGSNCYGYAAFPFPTAPPKDPFAINRASGFCGPEALPGARQYLGIVQAYVERIEALKVRDGAYPAAFPTGGADGITLYYRRNGNSGYAVLLALDKGISSSARIPILKPLMGCARIAMNDFQHTHDLGLYIPSYDETHELRPLLLFSPRVGFYFSSSSEIVTMPKYRPVPEAPPANPFAIAADCPPTLQPAAQAFAALIEPYVNATYAHPESHPRVPDGFRIVRHQAKGGTWLEMWPEGEFSQEIMPCLNVVGIHADALRKLGLDGTYPSSIDFTPRLGFYNKNF